MSLISSILLDASIYGFATMGIACTIFWGRTADLTPDASFTSGAVAAWLASSYGFSGGQLIVFGALGGGIAGFATFAVSRLRVQPLLASMVVVGLAYSVHWALMGRPLQALSPDRSWYAADSEMFVAMSNFGALLISAALLSGVAQTRLGLMLRAAAENPYSVPGGERTANAASLVFLVLGNCLVGLAGSMFASRSYFVEINMGTGLLLSGLGGLLLGWSFFRFSPRPAHLLFGAIVGAAILRAVVSLALLSGFPAPWFRALSAGSLLVCLFVATRSGRRVLQGLRL